MSLHRPMPALLLALLLLAVLPGTVSAAVIVPPPLTVRGIDVFGGPTFTVTGAYGPSDLLSLRAQGTVDLASGAFTANAAGIVVAPATTNTGAHPGGYTLSGSYPYAALLIGVPGLLPYVPVFPLDPAYGLGSATPPTDLSISRPLSDLWGPGVSVPSGTTFQFRVHDINNGDNSGAFLIGPPPEPSAAVPAPATAALLLAGLALLRRRRRA